MAAHGFRTWELTSTHLWLVWQPEPQRAPFYLRVAPENCPETLYSIRLIVKCLQKSAAMEVFLHFIPGTEFTNNYF